MSRSWLLESDPSSSSISPSNSFGRPEMDIENFVVLVIAILGGVYMLYCLFRPEDL